MVRTQGLYVAEHVFLIHKPSLWHEGSTHALAPFALNFEIGLGEMSWGQGGHTIKTLWRDLVFSPSAQTICMTCRKPWGWSQHLIKGTGCKGLLPRHLRSSLEGLEMQDPPWLYYELEASTDSMLRGKNDPNKIWVRYTLICWLSVLYISFIDLP